jgi:thiamine biosynthesis lipoprotein
MRKRRKAILIFLALFLTSGAALLCFWGAATQSSEAYAAGSMVTQTIYRKLFAKPVPLPEIPPEEAEIPNAARMPFGGESFAHALCLETGGAFNPYMGRLIALWNIDDSQGSAPRVPAQHELDAVLPLCDYKKVRLDDGGKPILPAGMIAHYGAIGKGAIIDFLSRVHADEMGAIISVGGQVSVRGQKPFGRAFKISLRDPAQDILASAGLFTIKNKAVHISTSGAYEKFFSSNGKNYGHILDYTTGYPPQTEGLLSVTVIVPEDGTQTAGARADAYSTACYVAGYDRMEGILRKNGCDAIFLYANGSAKSVGGVQEYFTLTGAYTWAS